MPTLIATTFFAPRTRTELEAEELDATEEIDAGPVIHRTPHAQPEAE